MIRSRRVLLILIALLMLSLTPNSTAGRNVAAAGAVVPTCPEIPPWFEYRTDLGGSYIGNGWDNGLIMVFRFTAIGGTIQGYLIQTVVDETGTLTQDTYTVTGIYDERQVSLQVEFFLSTTTMVGTWDDAGLSLSYPGDAGQITDGGFLAIGDDEALTLIDAWQQ